MGLIRAVIVLVLVEATIALVAGASCGRTRASPKGAPVAAVLRVER